MKFLKYFYSKNLTSKLIIILGFLGLLPFIFGLIDIWINKENLFFFINLTKYYGSIILTFLGAVYWGIIINDNFKNLLCNKIKTYIILWSIVPSFCAILILIFNHNITIIILALCFIFVQIVDELVIKYFKFPVWYLLLRRMLTIVVVFILLFTYLLIRNV